MTVTSQWMKVRAVLKKKSSDEDVKQTVDLTQELLANQTFIKQQAELIKSMTVSFAPLTELPEHEEIVVDQLDDLQVDNA